MNVAIALPVLVAGSQLLNRGAPTKGAHFDLPGALTASGGLFGLVYGLAHAETGGWSSLVTILSLIVGVVLLAVFVATEARVSHPLLPLRVLTDRTRGGSLLSLLIAGAALFAVFLFLTYYLQSILGYSPLRTGLAFLPMVAGIAVTAQIGLRILNLVGPRPVVPVGMICGAGGLLVLTQLGLHSAYAGHILPGLILVGVGLGLVMSPSIQGATTGIDPADAGVGSAMVSTMQQIGGSMGTAIFSTLAASSTTTYLHHHRAVDTVAASGALHGYITAFAFAAGVFAVGAVLAALLLPSGTLAAPDSSTPTAVG